MQFRQVMLLLQPCDKCMSFNERVLLLIYGLIGIVSVVSDCLFSSSSPPKKNLNQTAIALASNSWMSGHYTPFVVRE